MVTGQSIRNQDEFEFFKMSAVNALNFPLKKQNGTCYVSIKNQINNNDNTSEGQTVFCSTNSDPRQKQRPKRFLIKPFVTLFVPKPNTKSKWIITCEV